MGNVIGKKSRDEFYGTLSIHANKFIIFVAPWQIRESLPYPISAMDNEDQKRRRSDQGTIQKIGALKKKSQHKQLKQDKDPVIAP